MWHDCAMIREVPKMCISAGVFERTRARVYERTRANTRVSVRTSAVSRLILSWYEDVISCLCHNTSPSYCAIVSDQRIKRSSENLMNVPSGRRGTSCEVHETWQITLARGFVCLIVCPCKTKTFAVIITVQMHSGQRKHEHYSLGLRSVSCSRTKLTLTFSLSLPPIRNQESRNNAREIAKIQVTIDGRGIWKAAWRMGGRVSVSSFPDTT